MTLDIPALLTGTSHTAAIVAGAYTAMIVIAAVTALAATTEQRRSAALKVLEMLLRRDRRR